MTIRMGKMIQLADNADRIVLPQLNRYLIQRGDMFPLPADVLDFIIRQIAGTPRIREGTFSASSSGACLRAQELSFLGIPSGDVIDPQLQLIFDDGTWRHLRWQATLLMAGILKTAEFPLPWPNERSMGSMDGLGVVPRNHIKPHWRGKEFGFELKGTNQWTYKRSILQGPKDGHLDQIHRYFLVGGFDLFVVLYEDKDTQSTYEWVVEPDPKILRKQKRELDELNSAIDTKTLHPMLPQCKAQRKTQEWGSCPFAGISGPCIKAGNWPRVAGKALSAPQKPGKAPVRAGTRVLRRPARTGASQQ